MKLLSIDLESPLPSVPAAGAGEQWVLLRFHGRPMGMLTLDRRAYTPEEMGNLAYRACAGDVLRHLLEDSLIQGRGCDIPALDRGALPSECPQTIGAAVLRPLTVAVCTRDRADWLRECLESIRALDYPHDLLDVLVVDNAPADDTTRDLLAEYPDCRYVCEPRPGLDWARNRAVLEARGEVIAFTDDDVIVDAGWARALVGVFAGEPDAMAVTGLVVPHETDSDPQLMFERYGGFGRGFNRRYYQVDCAGGESAAQQHGGTGKFGTGANMAFRRSVFATVGLFDPALDVGTPANGGGDLEMFFRVLQHGHQLVYEPSAVVRHRHRRSYEQLRVQIANNGIGFFSYLVRSARAYPDQRGAFVRLGVWWLWWWNVRRLLKSFVRAPAVPRDLIIAELKGSLAGLTRYRRSRMRALEVAARFGPQA